MLMNYPIWEIPAPGLLIAFVAIVHVFISHFAVGGGLFLVVAERKARLESDAALLMYAERHSRFFAMLTLVAGALTGVGIWFTIALIHPAATSALLAAFVWGWAIEWTFFVTEIAAAILYAYGWHRVAPATHMRIGWIYAGAAWLSLAVINAVLAFMLTPGAWLTTRSFWDGVLNPTYLPSLVARTAGAVGLAGIYVLMTASWMADRPAKARIARYAGVYWILPNAIMLPLSLSWYVAAANTAGVPVAETFGATAPTIRAIVAAALTAPASGHPIAQYAVLAFTAASIGLLVTTSVIVAWRSRSYGRPSAAVAMLCGFATLGAAEFIREDLRKPFVIGSYMLVTGVRLPAAEAARTGMDRAGVHDRFAIDVLERESLLRTALWTRNAAATGDATADEISRGRELFRLSCAACHTTDGYLAARPLVRGMTVAGAAGLLTRLARPVGDDGRPAAWTTAHGRMQSWRGRRMPPFAGTPEERHALAMYLASLGGMTPDAIARSAAGEAAGARVFDESCSACHGPAADFPFKANGRTADAFYTLIGNLPALNDAMPPFEGSDADRRALADYLPTLADQRGVR